ncbi:hypothetical protein BGZ58_003275 [Dissophora ornata]|nr:hypothetical protein BGZ58_003275 [Dissophora ornata]
MDFYSFRYPPRPTPSEAHKPSRYNFHNLEQDQVFKRTQFSFQKEGVPPKSGAALNKMSLLANSATAMVMRPAPEQLTDAEMGKIAGSAPFGVLGFETLDRSRFLVN